VDRAALEQLLDEMLSSLEELETKAAATLQFLKDQGHATEKDLAPYLEQAGNASNVRWRAARLRMMSLLSSALKAAEEPKEKPKPTIEAAETKSTPEPASVPRTARPEESSQEVPAELAQATKAKPAGDKQSVDAGKGPRPASSGHENTEQPASQAKAALSDSQPDEGQNKSSLPSENSDLNRKTEHSAPSKTKENAA
jgi:hypothetical protein